MSRTVLIVDDNREFAENISEILEIEGFETTIFDDPPSALDYARSHDFDMALVDVRMPKMDGITLYGKLVDARPQATFLLMTAFASDERLAEALAAGVTAVLNKPVRVDSLLELLSNKDKAS